MGVVVTGQFMAGALALAGAEPPRSVPSPSIVMRCHRQVWYTGKQEVKDNIPDNGESYISARSGGLTEVALADVVEAAGFGEVIERNITLLPDQLAKISMARGEADGILRLPDGTAALLEFKRKGVFDILDLLRSGSVVMSQPEEYIQMQCYMEALDLDRALYVASNWDRGAFTNRVRFAKDMKGLPRPDAAHVEWVDKDPKVVSLAIKRAKVQTALLDRKVSAAEVPRESDPFDGRFPCTWCPYLNACKVAG